MLFLERDPDDAEHFCSCGWNRYDIPLSPRVHARWHDGWANGPRVPAVAWRDTVPTPAAPLPLAYATVYATVPEQTVAYEAAHHFQREHQFSFNGWLSPIPRRERKRRGLLPRGGGADDVAYLLLGDVDGRRRVLGLAIASRIKTIREVEVGTKTYIGLCEWQGTPMAISAIWVAGEHRRQGIASRLIRLVRETQSDPVVREDGNVVWESPFTDDGWALAAKHAVDGRVLFGTERVKLDA